MAGIMDSELAELVNFHLTRERSGDVLEEVPNDGLRPALLAPYGDLSKLRYDYPLVLTEGDGNGRAPVRSLSALVNGALRDKAPRGAAGERVCKQVIGLEMAIRARVSGGVVGSLAELWDKAEEELLAGVTGEARELLRESLCRVRGDRVGDGEVVDCNDDAPRRVVHHVWNEAERGKRRRTLETINALIVGVSDVLRADALRSAEGRAPESLRRSMGRAYQNVFDFQAMSSVLGRARPRVGLPEAKRERLQATLDVLQSQRLLAEPERQHGFSFQSCAQALDAFEKRLPEMVVLRKAMLIAELELSNQYKSHKHDALFAKFDHGSLSADDLALFPSYLICLRAEGLDDIELAKLIKILGSDLPMKVLVQTEDILGDPVTTFGPRRFTVKSPQLESMVVGLGSAYVLQASVADLHGVADRLHGGVAYRGPALFSVFSGSERNTPDLPTYLASAAATQSRGFPSFTYDPGAGDDWASQFCVNSNPQPEGRWTTQSFAYEDDGLQRVSLELAFTLLDYAVSDKRYAKHFAKVVPGKSHQALMPASDFLEQADNGTPKAVPYVPVVDKNNRLHKAVVDRRLVAAARRCAAMWRRLQELGGIHNSHAERLLKVEREKWEQEKELELAALRAELQHGTAPLQTEQDKASTPTAEPAEPEQGPSRSPDEAYIDTPRCTTCNECTNKNSKMFVYDDNKQAYIADLSAGTYRQLVEAAEVCKVAIIHPGKPGDQNEPNLDDLVKRAAAFM